MRRWTEVHELAARLVADGKLINREIAERAGVSVSTVKRWRVGENCSKPGFPEFPARVEAIRREREERSPIDRREARIARMNSDWNRLQEIRRARGMDPAMRDVPGGTTGLIVRNNKGEYVVDHDLLAALGSLEALAAKEGCELVGKGAGDGRDTRLVVVEHVDSQGKVAGATPGAGDDPR